MRRKIVIDYRDELEDYLVMRSGHWAFFYRFLKRFLSILYMKASLVTSVTPAVAENLRKRNVNNVKVIHDGVDTRVFRPYVKRKVRSEFGLSKDLFVIAYLGNVYNPYRLDIVIRALKKLKEKNPKRKYLLILVGGGDVKSVIDLASSLELNDSIKYFGVISNPNEIAKVLSSADCGIIPYDDHPLWQKTYSTKLFEYCAVGLPIIGTVHQDSALAEVINLHNIGLITPPVNSDELALTLASLSANPKLIARMSVCALRFARTHDKEELARNLLTAIDSSK
jgi:glycosyltransferase involved in cell wall biosynthesis